MKTKIYSKQELQKKSEPYFKGHPYINKWYATNDGQFFKFQNSAQLHKTANPKLDIYEIERVVEQDGNEAAAENVAGDLPFELRSSEMTIKKATAIMQGIETVDVLNDFVDGDERKGIEAAYDARWKVITIDKNEKEEA